MTPAEQTLLAEAKPLARVPVATVPDPGNLRSCFGMFTTGITVVTAGRTVPQGMTANSFASVSLDPALVLVCVRRESPMHEVVLSEEAFAVSVLSAHQEQVARYFANKKRPRGEGEFDLIDTIPGTHTGAPIISGSLAWLECSLAAVYDGGDHSIFLGSVLDLGRSGTSDALLFFRGDFHRLEPGLP